MDTPGVWGGRAWGDYYGYGWGRGWGGYGYGMGWGGYGGYWGGYGGYMGGYRTIRAWHPDGRWYDPW